MHLQLSNELNDIITYAKEEAMRLGSYTITTDHIILGIIRHGENSAYSFLHKTGINLFEFKKNIEENIKKPEIIPVENSNRIILSKASENALKVMFLEARAVSRQYQPDAGHLLLAILRGQEESFAIEAMKKHNITYSIARKALEENIKETTDSLNLEIKETYDAPKNEKSEMSEKSEKGEKSEKSEKAEKGAEAQPVKKKGSSTPVLDSFGFDLTKAAVEERLDPVVGREKEIEVSM